MINNQLWVAVIEFRKKLYEVNGFNNLVLITKKLEVLMKSYAKSYG